MGRVAASLLALLLLPSIAGAPPTVAGRTVASPLVCVQDDGADVACRPRLNFGANVSVSDDPVNGRVDITATGGAGGGDVSSSSASSTDNEVARFDGTTGKLIQDGTGCILGDDGKLTGPCRPRSLLGVPSLSVVTAGQTLYMAPGSGVEQVEARVEQPVHTAVTLDRLACRTSVAIGVGNSVVVTLRKGTCGSLADGSSVCTLTGAASTPSTCTSGASDTVASGECHDLRVATSGTLAANPFVNCSLDRVGS